MSQVSNEVRNMTTIISATLVKELRERTGAGMMECKKALEIVNGDIERAIEELRKSGRTKADKKAGRIAAEGAIAISENGNRAVMIEINSETDFVARDNHFTSFVSAVAETALMHNEQEVAKLSTFPLQGQTHSVEESRLELVAKVGENVQIRRIVISHPEAVMVGTYKELARDIAMHIAASKPLVISPSDVSHDLADKEKEIYMAQAANSGKPQEIVEKMVAGRLKKFLDEVSLMGQPFVKDPDMTVGALLNKHRAKVNAFYRFEVGEGIEKVVEDFKDAVMSQVQGG
jgi:elongation factor Ts